MARASIRIKKGDTVYVLSGKEKGKTGKVLAINHEKQRAEVEKLMVFKRHYKRGRNPAAPEGGIVDKNGTIHVSNLALIDPESSRPTSAPALGERQARASPSAAARRSTKPRNAMSDDKSRKKARTPSGASDGGQGARRGEEARRRGGKKGGKQEKGPRPSGRGREGRVAGGAPGPAGRRLQGADHPGPDEGVRLQEPDAGAQGGEGRGQHGPR